MHSVMDISLFLSLSLCLCGITLYESIYTGILRYLGGRFPETTSAVDENGRTALHYAATIKDNGHFYNLLVHLGSNPKVVDKVTHSFLFV